MFLPSKAVTLHRRKDFPVTSARRKRCSVVVDEGDQRIAASMVVVLHQMYSFNAEDGGLE